MPLTHGVNLGHVLLVPESVSSQLTMPPLRMPKMSLLPKIAVASGNLRTVYVIGVDRGAGMTGQSHQGTAHEQRDNEGGTQGEP